MLYLVSSAAICLASTVPPGFAVTTQSFNMVGFGDTQNPTFAASRSEQSWATTPGVTTSRPRCKHRWYERPYAASYRSPQHADYADHPYA